MGRRLLGWMLALCAGAPGVAGASTFDEATGKLSVDDAAWSISFDDAESIPEELAAEWFDQEGEAQQPWFTEDADGLEAEGALSFGGQATRGHLYLEPIWEQFAGRRVEVRIWQLPQGTRARVQLEWGLRDPSDPQAGLLLGVVTLMPTGRATDDGWLEFASGPFDFGAGAFGPARLSLHDVQFINHDLMSYAGPEIVPRVHLDALEIQDLGPALVPAADCTALDETTSCGPHGLCLMGQCVDGAIVAGAMPHDAIRGDYLTRRIHEYRFLEGGRVPQERMPHLEAHLEALREGVTAADFWPGVHRGVEQLWDGHASAPTMTYGPRDARNLGVCLHLGHADLLPTGGTTPLVFEVTGDNPLANVLQEGDALVSIDGQPPYAWLSHLRWPVRYNGDPDGYAMFAAPYLVPAALQTGATLTFQRCPYVGPGDAAICTDAELETFDIDLAAELGGPVWSGMLPTWYADDESCDYRFRRGVDDPASKDYAFAAYVDDGPVRVLHINGVPDYSWAEDWWLTIQDSLDPPPALLILDQRTGHGGAITAVDFLMGLLLVPQDFHRMELLPSFDRELDQSLWTALDQCYVSYYADCGGYLRWPLGGFVGLGPSQGLAGNTKLAVLNALDASGNDFTSKLATYRSAPTRIFGHAPTFGAFGPINRLPDHLDEVSGGSVQVYDTIFVEQPQDPPGEFETSTGVSPDEMVWQRQSDAVQGIDTMMEAAKQWLLQ